MTDILYAGKFKTVEELEAGYNNAAKVYQDNTELQRKHDEAISAMKAPDAYQVPAGIELHENDIEDLKNSAKNSGLTQAQFDKLAATQNAKVRGKLESFENAKKEIGADNLNLLQDFIGKNYPEKAAAAMLKEAIKNKDVRDSILAQRTAALNSSVPGSGRVSQGTYGAVNHKDLVTARAEMLKTRGKARIEAQKRYVSLAAQLAHAGDA